MTSKLRRTIVGVGIALGGAAAPGCFGRSHFDAGDGGAGAAGDSNHEVDASTDGALDASTDDGALDASTDGALDASADGALDATIDDGALDASTDGALDASTDDGVLDASADGAIDPYCDVSWPPTKANPTPGTVPCVDPLHECTDAYPPRRCYRIDPATCFSEPDYDGPLYCVDGAWRCPPNSDEGERCTCRSADGGGCPDASAGDMPGADAGDAAN